MAREVDILGMRKQIIWTIVIAFFVGATGSIVLGRFVIPYFATFKGLSILNKLSTSAPIIINRREEVQLNEGVNLMDLSRQASNIVVSFYYGMEPNYKFTGNGIIMSNDGMIFASRSVFLPESGKLIAMLNDGTSYSATIRAVDPRSDLVVITIDAKNLPVAQLADARSLNVGQRVLGVGGSNVAQNYKITNGFVTNSMSNVSSPDRVYNSKAFEETIETDAVITSEFFGGPMINLNGRVVGMMANTANNILPAEDLQTALFSYLATGKVIRAFIGIQYLNLSQSLAKLRNLSQSGALVTQVDLNSSASRGGLLVNDFIVSVDGQAIGAGNSFEYLFNNHPISAMKLKVIRTGVEKELTIQPDSN